jgi:hypothetical protein
MHRPEIGAGESARSRVRGRSDPSSASPGIRHEHLPPVVRFGSPALATGVRIYYAAAMKRWPSQMLLAHRKPDHMEQPSLALCEEGDAREED